jgi:dipeptidyl aminopeptidase/acylaminoacyl peptidase
VHKTLRLVGFAVALLSLGWPVRWPATSKGGPSHRPRPTDIKPVLFSGPPVGKRIVNPSELPIKRPVTVPDAIRMNRVAGSSSTRWRYTGASSSDFAVFSPDGKQFVIVLKKGNLEENTNDYSMLLFATDKVFDRPVPKTLVSFASSSNREGIKNIRWLDDNDTLLFLGEHPAEATQLYSVRCSSGKITQLTHEERSVVGYSASATGMRIVFGTENPSRDFYDAKAVRDGFLVSSEPLFGLIAGHIPVCCQQLFVLDVEQPGTRHLRLRNKLWQDPLDLHVSPDGRYLIVKTNVATFPALWSEYTNKDLKQLLAMKVPKGSPTSFIDRYELIDIQEDISRILLDSPVAELSEVAWSSDSHSAILTGVYLPLNVQDPAEVAARKSGWFTVEVEVPNLDIVKIENHDLKLLGWDPTKQVLMFRSARNENLSGTSTSVVRYRRQSRRWERITSESGIVSSSLPEIGVEQDLNTPPRIVATRLETSQTAILFDPNPQFKDLAFGAVEDLSWAGGGGREVHGGLYLPPDYESGHRYPLVIQTHGFDRHGFWIDGSFTTGFAAQPLAAKGIVVLQVPDSHDAIGTPEEAPRMIETYEKAIAYLDARGIIDRNRVGIVGFSRTCFYVKYMLTHSKYHIAAASLADGVDGGYFAYLAFPGFIADRDDLLLGAAPFGKGLSIWLKRSPGFLLDKVQTPLRIQAIGPASLLSEWQWFAGLSRLNKPVEFMYLPDGDHILEKPWERMVSQQGNVDWFCFWLKGEEDTDPAKTQQYARWRELKSLKDGKK